MGGTVGDGRWGAVVAQIVLGVAHDMNNRLLALIGLRELAEDGLDAELLRLFDEELARLEAATRLLRRLGEPPAGPETVTAAGFLETIRQLHASNSALRGVETEWTVQERLPALHVDPVTAARALLVALDSAGRVAAETGSGLKVNARAEEDALLIDIFPAGADPENRRALEAAGARAAVEAGFLRARFDPA